MTAAHPEPPAAVAPLWRPSQERAAAARLTRFHAFAAARHGAPPPVADPAAGYRALHRWSVTEPDAFWAAVADWSGVRFATPYTAVLADAAMPGARWFPGATLNYAEHALRPGEPGAGPPPGPALLYLDERQEPAEIGWAELRRRVGSLAAALRGLGVRPGDRVAGYLPNVPEAVVALLASAATGAVWTSCSPDFGVKGVLDRFRQVEPVVLFAADGYRYAGRVHERAAAVAGLRQELPTLRAVVHVPVLGRPVPPGALEWAALTEGEAEPEFTQVPFDHPLWVLYSSGTTGAPKALVHSQGGILLEHLKQLALHCDLGPGDRLFWYTSTGWMMWNFLVGALLTGTTAVLYDGAPAHPGQDAQWRIAERTRATLFGTSASYVMACAKAGLRPGRDLDLSATRCVGTTGSPLPPAGFRWLHEEAGRELWIASVSGGTDVCSCFAGAVPVLPVWAGELQAPCLGTDLRSYDAAGRPLVDEVGELVVAGPMPSMPVKFWNDPDGSRYRDSYFSVYEGVWRHGDWTTVTSRGTVVIHGRSDSTLNRQGVRLGSADLYEVVDRLPGIAESLVVGVELPSGGYWMPLFVRLAEGAVLDGALREAVRSALREELSPRHVPDEIIAVPGIPHTLTGKRLEVPVKRLLQGVPLESAVNPGSVDDVASLRFFARLASERAAVSAADYAE